MEPAWIGNSDYFDANEDSPTWIEMKKKEDKLENIECFFKQMISELYEGDDLDEENVEWFLEEIAYQLNMKLPEGRLRIMRNEGNR